MREATVHRIATRLVGTEISVSGGAERRGPDGGGPVALIATRHIGAAQ